MSAPAAVAGRKRKRSEVTGAAATTVAAADLRDVVVQAVALAGGDHGSADDAPGFADVLAARVAGRDDGILIGTWARPLPRRQLAAMFHEPPRAVTAVTVVGAPDNLHAFWVADDGSGAVAARFWSPAAPAAAYPGVDGGGAPLGLAGWLAAHESRSAVAAAPKTLQAAVDGFVAAFDTAVAAGETMKAELARRVDEEGFTLVKPRGKGGVMRAGTAVPTAPGVAALGGGGAGGDEDTHDALWRYGAAAHTASAAGGATAGSRSRKHKHRGGSAYVTDFYRFQRQEAKIDRMADLRARFAEDRERLRKLREQRHARGVGGR